MKLIIALGFLIAVSASPLANIPSKDVTVAPIENFPLLEQDEIKKTSELILETIICLLDKIQAEIIEGDSQKVNEGIQGILNTIQNILKSRGKEVTEEFKENGQTRDKIHAEFVLGDSQQDQYDGKKLELPEDSVLAQENTNNENKVINNDKESDKTLDAEQKEKDLSEVKFIDMVPQKVSDEAQSSKDAENNEQTEDHPELQEQILNYYFIRQPQEIQYIPWMNRQPVPY